MKRLIFSNEMDETKIRDQILRWKCFFSNHGFHCLDILSNGIICIELETSKLTLVRWLQTCIEKNKYHTEAQLDLVRNIRMIPSSHSLTNGTLQRSSIMHHDSLVCKTINRIIWYFLHETTQTSHSATSWYQRNKKIILTFINRDSDGSTLIGGYIYTIQKNWMFYFNRYDKAYITEQYKVKIEWVVDTN